MRALLFGITAIFFSGIAVLSHESPRVDGATVFNHTNTSVPTYAHASLSCTSCHLAGGTQTGALPLIGTAARYPEWNPRAKRVIALNERIAMCFLNSMNGRAPAPRDPVMLALVAYVESLAKRPATAAASIAAHPFDVRDLASANAQRGGALYGAKCAMCHGATGAGIANAFPPLWGRSAFNAGAGMARTAVMAPFIRTNMPLGAPGTLSDHDAADISAFVVKQKRPPLHVGTGFGYTAF